MQCRPNLFDVGPTMHKVIQMFCVYWVTIQTWVFLRSPNKGFWACLGDLPPDMPRRPETWVLLCNLLLKLRGISRSYAILGSDSPQSNKRKDNSLWVTPFIPRERPNVKHAIAGYLRLPQPTPADDARCESCISTAVERGNQGTPLAIRPKIMARYEEAAASFGWLL